MYYLLAFSFGLNDVFGLAEMAGVVLLVTAVSNLVGIVPAAGGGIGTFEVAAAETLRLLSAEGATYGAYIIVVHAASTPGITDIRFGMVICMPIIGISMPGLPSIDICRWSTLFFKSCKP